SLEALARWQHPEYGMVYPGDFIPLAEETGHIVDLGAAMLHQVCRQIARWRQAGLHTPTVAINVSAKQLRDAGFVQLVRDAVGAAGISCHDIEIEVTESCVMVDPEMSVAILETLVGMGVRISLDDYGTGYSSLSSIKRLPLYAIKIDRSFIGDIGIDSNDDVIVASTISMSHGLGLRVVAEGVETREQLKRLRMLGCEEMQGYLFSRPLALEETEKLLQRGVCEPQGSDNDVAVRAA
ncbi:MAG TPA: EAL domain-containing protein, partial [Rhodocyclaceae bacterium]|nr:EAL domain-containing protein [Rhodocyclaceae bacterium]